MSLPVLTGRPRSWLIVVVLLLAGCSRDPAAAAHAGDTLDDVSVMTADQRFDVLAAHWLDASMGLAPVGATLKGDHRFDGELDDLSAEGRNAELDLTAKTMAELQALTRAELSRDRQVDAGLLDTQLRYRRWALEVDQAWAWDPLIYADLAGSALYGLMARDYAPLPDRLAAAIQRLDKLPALLVEMRVNLDPARVPAIHAETAAQQIAGVTSLIDELIVPQLGALDADARARSEAAIERARAALAHQAEWISKTLLPSAQGDFRIGAARYDQKLHFALDASLSRQEIRTRAEAEMQRVRAEMYGLARTVVPGGAALPEQPTPIQQQATIAAALELAARDRPARDAVVDTARAALERATAFVRDSGLVSIPSTPLDIILMPEFQRGVAVAYCDPPGPLDKDQPTFYAVSPIPDDWTTAQVDSFLKEYNTRSIHELTIHEAMPGHFLQLAHSNRYPSTLRAVLYSGSFVEGWAVYAERLMAEMGYYGADPLFQLVQRKWYLRSVANAILDQAVHVDGMTEEEAMKLMTVDAFQEKSEAAGKWTRVRLTSAQLPTYFVGAQEHFALRAEAERRAGPAFSLRTYHDQVLSYGSPPVRYVRALMFDEPMTP